MSNLEKHSYILQPVSGSAKYSKDRSDASTKKDQALQNADVKLEDVTLCLSKVGKWSFCLSTQLHKHIYPHFHCVANYFILNCRMVTVIS